MFKDVFSLYELHTYLNQSFSNLKENEITLPCLFTDDKKIPHLKIYKSFMRQYAASYQYVSDFYMNNKEFKSICTKVIVS